VPADTDHCVAGIDNDGMAIIGWEDNIIQNIGTQWGLGALICALVGWGVSYFLSEETEKGKELADEWGNGFTWAFIMAGGLLGAFANQFVAG
jgi:hypothetical protein